MKKILLGVVALLVIVIGAISTRSFYYKNKFELVHPKKGDVVEAIYGLGKVKSEHEFDVRIGVMSEVLKVFVKEGDKVEKGGKLIHFDAGGVFKAPFSGTVTLVSHKENEVVLPQVTVLRVEDLKDKFIEVSLEQDAALRVKSGQRTQVVFESQSQKKYIGEVIKIYPREGEFITRVEVKGLPENILPGMTADVVIEVGKKKDVLLVPVKSITNGMVLRLRDEKREKIGIETGNNDGMWIEITSGDLTTADQVLIKR